MNEHHPPPAGDAGDRYDLAGLLRAAGGRPQPPPTVADAVRSAVGTEWRATVEASRPRRRYAPWLAAAGVAALAVAMTIVATHATRATAVATVSRLDGAAEVR